MSVLPLAARSTTEPWLTKAQLADRLQVSTRWIDLRRAEGMPCEKWAGVVRFRLSAVETWLAERSVAA
jgi:phage terminase Nu1 subunit (DNA packaging protein)